MGGKLQSIGGDLTKSLTLPIVAIGGAAFKAATDFEEAFSGVAKTVDGVAKPTGELTEFGKQLKQGFRDLAKEIPVTVGELSKIGEAAGAMGIGKDKILPFVEVMAKLGATTDLTSEQAATGIAKIQNVYRSAGVDTDRFASSLVALGNAGASTESQILSFAERMGGAAVQARISQAEVLGWSNAMASVGLNAELGSTAWNKVVSAIGMAVDLGGPKLQQFAEVAGMTGQAFANLFRTDASEAVNRLVEGFGRVGSSGGNLTQTMINLGMKTSGIQMTFKNLASSGDMVRQSLDLGKKAWLDNVAMQEEFNKKAATTTSQLKILFNKLYDIGITLGETMLPAFKRMQPAIEGFLKGLADAVVWFSKLPTSVQTAAFAFAALLASLGPIAYTFGTIASGGSAVISLMRQLGLVSATTAVATTAAGAGSTAAAAGVGTLAAKLGLVAQAAAVVGVAFASWKFGSWIGDWSGLTDAVGKAHTALFEFIGLLPKGSMAQYDAMRSAQQLQEAWEKAGIKGRNDKDIELPADKPASANPMAGMFANIGTAAAAAKEKVSEFEKGVRSLVDKFGAGGQIQDVNQWIEAIKRIGGIGALTDKGLKDFIKNVYEAVESMRALGQQVPITWAIIADTVTLDKKLQDTRDFIGQSLGKGFEMKRGRMMPGTGAIDPALLMGAVPGAIESQNVSADVPFTLGLDFGNVMKTGVAMAFGSLPQTLFEAISGGTADLGKKLGSVLGGQLGTSLGGALIGDAKSGIGKFLSGGMGGMLGQTLGNAVSAIIPGLGSLLGGLIGPLIGKVTSKIWHGIQGFFGTDEEARDVNPARDAFLAQFGEAGTGAGSGFQNLAAKLTELTGEAGGGALFRALTGADTMAEFNAAVAAIEEKLTSVNTSAADGFNSTTAATEGFNLQLQGSDEAIKALGETQLTVVNTMLAGFDALMAKLTEFINLLTGAQGMVASMPEVKTGGVGGATGGEGWTFPEAGGGVWNSDGVQLIDENGNILVGGNTPLPGGGGIPRFANEGVVNRPTLAMIGDAPEPEYVLRRSTVAGLIGGGGGRAINVYLSGTLIGNAQEFRDAVARAYHDAVEGGGSHFQRGRKLVSQMAAAGA